MSLGILCHFFNEEMLLPHFVKHHLPLVDQAIMINHGSTDRSVEIIAKFAPKWRIVDTSLNEFDAAQTDIEVMDYEREIGTKWKLALNVTEWLFVPDFKDKLEQLEKLYPEHEAFGMRSLCLVDGPEQLGLPLEDPLWKKHSWGRLAPAWVPRFWRYVHKGEDGKYALGRHGTSLRAVNINELLLLWWGFSPWPQAKARKLQIQTRIPAEDKVRGYGIQHLQNEETINNFYNHELNGSHSLFGDPTYAAYYAEMIK